MSNIGERIDSGCIWIVCYSQYGVRTLRCAVGIGGGGTRACRGQKATVKLGSTTIVEMHNVLRDTPKTGDTTNLPLLYTLAGLSAVGIAVCGVIGFKKKKKEDRN